MLDEYGLRLLAEIGVDVYLPRTPSSALTLATDSVQSSVPVDHSAAMQAVGVSGRTDGAAVLILGAGGGGKLLADIVRALRGARLEASMADVDDVKALANARGVLVLGEALARRIGAGLPAQRQNEIAWVVAAEPAALARSAVAKRALWGEIKRLSRSPGLSRRLA